jgi:Chaperone of endosialidase
MNKITKNVQLANGNSVPSASILIENTSGGNATLWQDYAGTISQTNPVTANEFGEYSFYVADGQYNITTSGIGIVTETELDIPVYNADALAANLLNKTSPTLGAKLIGFFLSIPGFVGRLLADKLGDRLHIKDFLPTNYVTDGTVDYTVQAQAAVNAFGVFGGQLDCSGGRWLIDSANLNIPTHVTCVGPYRNVGQIDGVNYPALASAFIVNPLYTIKQLGRGSGIFGMAILRKSLGAPPTTIGEATTFIAAFAGKACTVGSGINNVASDTAFEHNICVGFEYGYYNISNTRARVRSNNADCTNGFYMQDVLDKPKISDNHCWPFTTIAVAAAAGYAATARQGIGFTFKNVDWVTAVNCFDYGHDTGFLSDSSHMGSLIACGADGYPANNTNTKGFRIIGTTHNMDIVSPKISSKDTQIEIDITGDSNQGTVKVLGGTTQTAAATTGTSVYLKNGRAIVNGLSMYNAPFGIKTDASAGMLTAINNSFQLVPTPWSLANPDNAIIHSNQYVACIDGSIGERKLLDNISGINQATYYNSSAGGEALIRRKARGTQAAPTSALTNDFAKNTVDRMFDGTNFLDYASYRTVVAGTVATGAVSGQHIWGVSNVGSASIDRWAMSAGGLFPTADNAYSLGSGGNRPIALYAVNGTIQTSDERLKTDITPSALGLKFILAVKPISYKWISGRTEVLRQIYRNEAGEEVEANVPGAIPSELVTKDHPGVRTHWGFSAQQVKYVVDDFGVDFAGWVLADKDNPDSTQSINYAEFVAPLAKSVQELYSVVIELKAEIAMLKAGK